MAYLRPIYDLPNLVNRNCQYCQVKKNVLQDKSDLKFRPATLKQQTLLEIAYRTYGREVEGNLPLPPAFIEKIKGIHQELDRWRYGIWNLRSMDSWNRQPSTGAIQEPNQIYCFYDQVHWTRELKIDRRATANMILECLKSYDDPDHFNAFFLAIVHCQEDHIRHFWSQGEVMTTFDQGLLRVWPLPRNQLLSYWLLKLIDIPDDPDDDVRYHDLVPNYLNSMSEYPSLHPISDDEWLYALQFMWPDIVESQRHKNMEIWLRNAVSSAIDGKCLQVASFIWDKVPIEQRLHMLSADEYKLWKNVVKNGHFGIFAGKWDSIGSNRCLVLEEAAKIFSLALEAGYGRIVDDTWNVMTNRLRNTVLKQYPDIFIAAIEMKCFQLAIASWNAADSGRRTWILENHPKAFCTAAEFGIMKLVTVMWGHATEFQRRQLVFEDNCVSFRKSCAIGHVGIVRLLWQWASLDQRLQLLSSCDGEALSSAFRNGRMRVVQFLWQNMHPDAIMKAVEGSYVDKKALSDFICNSRHQQDIEHFLVELYEHGQNSGASSALKSILLGALQKEAALKVLLKRADKTGNWEGITALLRVFDDKQKAWFRRKMCSHVAKKCGLTAMKKSGAPTEEIEDKDEDEDEDEDEFFHDHDCNFFDQSSDDE